MPARADRDSHFGKARVRVIETQTQPGSVGTRAEHMALDARE